VAKTGCRAAARIAKRARRQPFWRRHCIKDPLDCVKTTMFMLKMKLYNSDGECRELFLDELYKAQKELAEEMRRKYMYPVLREKGAATRSKATDYAKAEATRARNINKFMPGIEKHLEALPLMMAAAEKEGFNANALWTMQCDAGCNNVKNDIVCLLSHKQCFVCQRASPPMTPYGSPRSD